MCLIATKRATNEVCEDLIANADPQTKLVKVYKQVNVREGVVYSPIYFPPYQWHAGVHVAKVSTFYNFFLRITGKWAVTSGFHAYWPPAHPLLSLNPLELLVDPKDLLGAEGVHGEFHVAFRKVQVTQEALDRCLAYKPSARTALEGLMQQALIQHMFNTPISSLSLWHPFYAHTSLPRLNPFPADLRALVTDSQSNIASKPSPLPSSPSTPVTLPAQPEESVLIEKE